MLCRVYRSWKNSRLLAVSSLLPGAKGGQYRLARLPEMQPLGEALDKSWGQRHEL